MKRLITLCAMLSMVLGLALPVAAAPQTLQERLKGYFLLSVENRGEIWYVYPETGKRSHVANANVAWDLIKTNMVGITNADLARLPLPKQAPKDKQGAALRDRLRGRFLLAVESKGEVWFVNPHDGYRYFLGTGEDTYQEVKRIALGIRLSDLQQIPVDGRLASQSPAAQSSREGVPLRKVAGSDALRIDMAAVKSQLPGIAYRDAMLGFEFASTLWSAQQAFKRDNGHFVENKWLENVFEFNMPIAMDATGFTLAVNDNAYWVWDNFSMEFFKFYFENFAMSGIASDDLVVKFVLPTELQTAQHGLLQPGTHYFTKEGLLDQDLYDHRDDQAYLAEHLYRIQYVDSQMGYDFATTLWAAQEQFKADICQCLEI
jgi:hypothetical protein